MTAVIIIAAIALVVVGLLHIYWALGGRWGYNAAVPRDSKGEIIVPSAGAAILVAVLVFVAAAVLLVQSGLIPILLLARIGAWICLVVFAVRGLASYVRVAITRRPEWRDLLLYAPLCLFLALAFLLSLLA